jgi:pantoate--beta-alanine ligase
MQIIHSVQEMQATARRLRQEGKRSALVPTSGAIHAGHLHLIEMARGQADLVVVSCFVNPREFGPNEDFARYPRDAQADTEACRAAAVDILFAPTVAAMYPAGYSSTVTEDTLSLPMCGISRPHYFRGVCTVHAKLFNIVRPDVVVLGMRDAQKTAVLRKLVADLNYPLQVLVGETVRAADGLALSARNAYLNEFQRRDALTLYRALGAGRSLAEGGISNIDRVLAEVTHHISLVRRLRVIYVAAVDIDTMEPVRAIVRGRTLVTAAVWCDEVRLLDHILL